MLDAEYVISEMKKLARECARITEEGFDRMDMEGYKDFLDVVCHYTRTTAGRLEAARSIAHTEDLREYFEHEIKEEEGHHLLAQENLERLGGRVSDEQPTAIRQLLAIWDEIKVHKVYGYLGARYVYENVIPNHRPDAYRFMERLGLEPSASTFVDVHREADVEHGQAAEAVCRHYMDEGAADMLAGARKAADAWQGMIRCALALPSV